SPNDSLEITSKLTLVFCNVFQKYIYEHHLHTMVNPQRLWTTLNVFKEPKFRFISLHNIHTSFATGILLSADNKQPCTKDTREICEVISIGENENVTRFNIC